MLFTSAKLSLAVLFIGIPSQSHDCNLSKLTMTNFTLLCITFALASVSLLVTCTKMSTEMTTQAPKPMDNTKMMDKSKMADNPGMADSKTIESKGVGDDIITKDNMDLIDAMTMCNESFRTEMSFLISLNESGSFPDETDKTPKCFLRCVLQTLEIATMDDGKIDPARAATIFADERGGEDVLEISTVCAQRDEDNHCEMAYNFLKCLFSMEIERNNKKTQT